MELAIILVAILGYLFIIFEHPIKINKAAPALLIGVLCWTIYVWGANTPEGYHLIEGQLSKHLAEISEILFFLIGAMTIVELIEAHHGFKVITNRIGTNDSRKLLWIICILSFFMSALLDNLTTAIVMVTLLRKLVRDPLQRKLFAGMIIISANAGGAWSPIGDVTTTMLWIGGQITTGNIVTTVFLPSVVAMVVPLTVLTMQMKGCVIKHDINSGRVEELERIHGSKRMLFTGIGALLFVPIFKTVTHLPPYMGMFVGLSVVWILSELIHFNKSYEEKKKYSAVHALTKIDTASVLFFMGILLIIGALQSVGLLETLATIMNETIGNLDIIVFAIGIASAIVDNVPLVAASMGMYDMATYPTDHKLWEFLAYCAGTGGSILIIGSAAGVTVMGMEKIDFVWYVKKISFYAFIGYAAGAAVYLLQYSLLH